MALAFYDDAALSHEAALEPLTDPHVQTYRKFAHYARIAACSVPFFVAFVLYWFK